MGKNSGGWIKLHRKLADNELWLSEPFTRGQAWVDLLLLANHKTGIIRRRGIIIKVGRGQLAYSEESLAERWRWSKGKVRRFFSELAGQGMISRQVAEIIVEPKTVLKNQAETVLKKISVNSLIYIENYNQYQGNGTEDRTEEYTENGTEEPFVPIIEEIKKERGRKSPTLAPEHFPISDQMKAYAQKKGYTGDLQNLSERFLNYHRSKGTRFSDWQAAFRNWILKEVEFHPPGPSVNLPINGGRSLDEVLS